MQGSFDRLSTTLNIVRPALSALIPTAHALPAADRLLQALLERRPHGLRLSCKRAAPFVKGTKAPG